MSGGCDAIRLIRHRRRPSPSPLQVRKGLVVWLLTSNQPVLAPQPHEAFGRCASAHVARGVGHVARGVGARNSSEDCQWPVAPHRSIPQVSTMAASTHAPAIHPGATLALNVEHMSSALHPLAASGPANAYCNFAHPLEKRDARERLTPLTCTSAWRASTRRCPRRRWPSRPRQAA